VLAGSAFGALLLVVVAYEAVGAVVTVAHEAGHMVVGALTGHGIHHFQVTIGGEGATSYTDKGWGPVRILLTAAGYTTPPLLGLGGAALLADGKVRPLLWTVVVLLVLALSKAEKEWTTFVVLLAAAATGYVALYGSPLLAACSPPGWCGSCCSGAPVQRSCPAPATAPTRPPSRATR
jgi:Peptidase M50B-like